MPWGRPRLRGWMAALLFAVQGAGAQTQPPLGADGAEGLAGARQKLEAAKAAAMPGAAATAPSLPALNLPAFNSSPPELPWRVPVQPARTADQPRPAADWALPERTERGRPRGGSSGEEAATLPGREKGEGATSLPASSRARDGLALTTSETAARELVDLKPSNPLSPFLSGWISAQDYRLLTSVRDASRPWASVPVNSGDGRSGLNSEAMVPATPGEPRRAVFASPRTPNEAAGRASNPYLDSLVNFSPSPGAAAGPVVTGSTSSSVPAVVSPSLAPEAGTGPTLKPARIPDFVRSNADEKYFKPLKRF